MERLIRAGSVFAVLAAFAGCGATNKVEVDTSQLWSGGSTQVRSGGYWFTYIDHIAWMAEHPDLNPGQLTASQGASITPLSDMDHPLTLESDPDTGSGHGDTVHVTGNTPAAPAWTDVTVTGNWFDTYYQQLYPDSLNVAYPVAGVGFGFVPHSANGYDPSQKGKFVGFVFDMKTRQNTVSVDAQLALVCSATNGDDLHDDKVEDAFPAPGCTFAKAQSSGETLAQQAADYLSGPNNYTAQTCFLYEHKMVTPKADNQWSTYCVLWNEMTVPDWVQANAQPPEWSDETLQTCATKLKWEMYKPLSGDPSAFDVYLDNIKLITRDQAAGYGCDVSALPLDRSKVIGPRGADAG